MSATRNLKSRLASSRALRSTFEAAITLPYRSADVFVTHLDDVPLTFATRDAHSKRWFHRGVGRDALHEPPITRAIAAEAAGATAFADVGAHLGWYSCIVGASNRDCAVTAFELNASLIPLIEENLRLNGCSDSTVVNAAAGSKPGEASYAGGSRSPGLRADFSSDAPGATAPVITLDDHFRDRRPPNLLKIDVEGAEAEVLAGASGLIESSRPTIFLEVHPDWLPMFGSSLGAALSHLLEADYECRWFDDHHGAGDLKPLPDDLSIPNNTMLLCRPS